MVKFLIPVQSISDIITNSSSETLCVISSNAHLKEIYDLLRELTNWTNDYEDGLVVRFRNKDDEDGEDYPDNWIELELPYCCDNMESILFEGIKAILENKFKDNYEIKEIW